ncbi:MAG TPA: RluA family pseudouridine synthase, partial [Leptospiraceae bacterium]|nr:RluA family pseudouridine synthase [Leptospiraceae bacterium]
YTYYDLERWREEIENKKIQINQENTLKDKLLKEGDEISFTIPDFIEPEIDSDYSVLYEDEYYFAIGKSGNLPVHPAGRYRKNNLTTLLESDSRLPKPFYLIHRIDRETSGIVLFGKSKLAASKLGELFEKNKIQKTYLVYVEGVFPESLEAKGFLEKDEKSKIRKKKKFTFEKTKDILWEVYTDFARVEVEGNISKIKAFPHTGKIHQIRATLHSLGYPLLGDKIYGRDESYFLEFIETGKARENERIERQALHAFSITFPHPFLKKEISIECVEPLDMQKIFSNSPYIKLTL